MLTIEQKEKRKNGLGASDSPIIMGYSTYMSPYQLWLEKTGTSKVEREETEQQLWGHLLEPVIRSEFARRNNLEVSQPDTLYHPDYPFILANLDGFIASENAVLEIKNSNSFMKQEWDSAFEDGIPIQYLIQIAKQFAVANADAAYCAVLFGGSEYQQYYYKRDRELEDMIIESDINFWDCVQLKIEPEMDRVNDFKIKFGQIKSDKAIVATGEIEEHVHLIKQTNHAIKSWQAESEALRIKIMKYMQEADCLTGTDGLPLVTWRSGKRGRTFLIKGDK
jgi:putative phage-type endonuclease